MYRKIQDIHKELFGKSMRPATISLWCCHGRHGHRLPALRVGATWHCKPEDYREFLEKSSHKADAKQTSDETKRSEKSRSKAIAKAEKALRTANI
jgi:hypothetical protein